MFQTDKYFTTFSIYFSSGGPQADPSTVLAHHSSEVRIEQAVYQALSALNTSNLMPIAIPRMVCQRAPDSNCLLRLKNNNLFLSGNHHINLTQIIRLILLFNFKTTTMEKSKRLAALTAFTGLLAF
jgi:hypothetical protein